MRRASIKIASLHRPPSLSVIRLLLGQRIDTEEVDGSNPFGPTIFRPAESTKDSSTRSSPSIKGYTRFR